MDFFREKYKDLTGKTDSMYIYVLYKCSQAKISEHVKKQLEILDRISDSHKRYLFKSRYYLFRDMIEQNADDNDYIYNNIAFISDSITFYPMDQCHIDVLKRFDHQNITYVYDNHFRLDYLEDLILNDNPYHMYRVNNNKIDYVHITKTKKVLIDSKESKPLDIKGFIDSTLPSKAKYIIHGTSPKLKDMIDDRAYTIINKYVKDEELIDLISKIDQETLLIALTDDLAMMNDPKHMHKVLFKKEIPIKIKNSQLQKLYISLKLRDKFLENMKKNNLDFNFKLIVIDQSVKSFVDGREKLLDQFDGVVGIAYY